MKTYIIKTILCLVYVAAIYILFAGLGHSVLGGTSEDTLLFSAIVALIINMFLAGFFETPRDVMASALNVAILMAPYLRGNIVWIHVLFIYAVLCFVLATTAIALYDPENNSKKNSISNFLKHMATIMGDSKLLFGLAIMGILISFYNNENIMFYVVTLAYVLILSSKPIQKFLYVSVSFVYSLFISKHLDLQEPIGKMVAVQSKDTFIIDLIDSKKRNQPLKMFDFVEFRHGADDNMFIRGFVIDRYALDSQQQIKVLASTNNSQDVKNSLYENNIVYKSKPGSITDKDKEVLVNFVGTVGEGSDITKIRFEYSPNRPLTTGSLLSVSVKSERTNENVLYQVTQAVTEIKKLDNRNETGLIVATATQLGVWRTERRNFENYGWVPPINSKVMLAKDVVGPTAELGELEIGKIENTDFRVLVNINDLVTHHFAILGTTGTGKSVFARDMIKKISKNNIKVFCIDFTGEIKTKINCLDLGLNEVFEVNYINVNQYGLNSQNPITPTQGHLIEHIEHYILRKDIKLDRAETDYVHDLEIKIIEHIKSKIKNFVSNEINNICLFELQDISNTELTLEYTKFLFKALFSLAKDEGLFKDKKACIVLEEAHTVIPEWNMSGGTDKISSKLTNTISQIALQGRKYNIGLMIIAQRTANISKTILTQCNTIISFKQFDNTSRDFLINHFGEEFVKSLPSLKFRQAVIAGKALISDMPIMFKVPNIDEVSNINQTPPQQVVTETIPLAEETEGVIVPEETKIFQANTDFNIE